MDDNKLEDSTEDKNKELYNNSYHNGGKWENNGFLKLYDKHN